MAFSTLHLAEVHDVLSVMQKNLECPICLDLMKEPVTTKCDHIFCRFCMLKLINKKKKGLAECPMCKHEVTKRSLQESPRFKLLVEGLLKTIHAFELDTGYKFSSSPDMAKKALEAISSEKLLKDGGGIIQSTGYRSRGKRAPENGQENHGVTLKMNSDVKLAKDPFETSSCRSKRPKRSSGKHVHIKLGSASSQEDLLEKAGSIGVGDVDLPRTPHEEPDSVAEKSDGKGSSTADDRLAQMPDAEEMIPSDLAEYEFSERENESSRGVASRAEDFRTTVSSLSEQHLQKTCGNTVSNSFEQQCEQAANHLQNGKERLRHCTKEANIEDQLVTVEDKGLKRRSSRRKSRDGDLSKEEASKRDIDSLYERESSPLGALLERHLSCAYSRKRAKTGIQRVNEWLSKLDDNMVPLTPKDDDKLYLDILPSKEDEQKEESDGDSFASDNTEIMLNPLEVTLQHELGQSSLKPTAANIEDKIFGKTYKRERKSNPQQNISIFNESKITEEVVMDPVNECTKSRTNNLKRRRKIINLQPEDFIRKAGKDEDTLPTGGVIQSIVDKIPDRKEEAWTAVTFEVSPAKDETMANEEKVETFPGEIKLVRKSLNQQVKTDTKKMGTLSNTHDQMQEANMNTVLQNKPGKSQTRRAPALVLVSKEEHHAEVVDSSISLLNPHNLVDLQIDSYPSSAEPRKKTAPTKLRRSRRLQLQPDETNIHAKPCIDLHVVQKENHTSESLVVFGGELTVPNAVCPKSAEHQEPNCNELRPVRSPVQNELCNWNKTLHFDPEKCPAKKDERDLHVTSSAEGLHCSPSELHNESEDSNSPNSTSLLRVSPKNYQVTDALQESHVNNMNSNSEVSSACLPNTLSAGINSCKKSNLEHTISQVQHPTEVLSTINLDAEDSELDTEYLLKTFKGAKRRSFLLQTSPQNQCAAASTLSQAAIDKSGNNDDSKGTQNHSKCMEDEPLTVGLRTGYMKENGYSDAHADAPCNTDAFSDHSQCSNTDCDNLWENDHSLSQNQEMCAQTETAKRCKKGLPKWSILDVARFSPLEVIESSYCNIFKDSNRPDNFHNTGEVIVEGTDSSTINETELSEANNRAERAEVSKNEGLALNLKPPPIAVRHQNPAGVSFKVTASETSRAETEQVGRDCYQSRAILGEQGNQFACAGEARGSVVENFPEQPAAVSGSAVNDTPGLSATPDGLLCFSTEDKGIANSSHLDMNTKSGLPRTLVDARLVEGSSSGSSMSGFKRCAQRQPAVKLFSSESSEEEELPCFRALLFSEAFNQSYDSAGQKNSNESSVKQQGGGLVLSSDSVCEQQGQPEQNKPVELSRTGTLSSSQESECSVDLFSSQSNISENSAAKVVEAAERSSTLSLNRGTSPLGTKETAPKEIKEVPAVQNHAPAAVDVMDEQLGGQSLEHRLGEGSEYESEASHTGDSSGLPSQSEILTTQQRDAMQNNLEKLQKEMAVLEAVLEQNGTQVLQSQSSPGSPSQHDASGCFIRRLVLPEKGTPFASKPDTEGNEKGASSGSADNEHNVIPDYPLGSDMEEMQYKGSPTPPATPSKSQLSKKRTQEKVKLSLSLLKELKESIFSQDDNCESVNADQQESHNENETPVPDRSVSGEKGTGIKRSSARVLARLYENIGVTPNKECPSLRSSMRSSYSHFKDSLVSPCIMSKDQRRKHERCERETVASTFVSPVRGRNEPVVVKTPVVTTRRKISMVASGLNQSELLLVQKFSRKTQSTYSHQITEGTTHVIMKTDANLVCERTLKYFLGIAGRKWVVSHQWIVQCFKEGRILDEFDFEVKGDVINGRNHRGPRRARLAADGVLWRDFEICCYGSFTDMTTEHLESMVMLCGGSVIKQPHLFTHELNSTAVVVVQPDACPEETDFGAIQRKYNVTVVTREWMLDSVACYECQKFNAYLLSDS